MGGVRARLLGALAVIVAVLGTVGPNYAVPQATAQAGLFADAARQPAADAVGPLDRAVVRSRYVDVNLSLMDGTPRGATTPLGRGDVLTLNLFNHQSAAFPEVTVTAVRDRVVRSSTGRGFVWMGHVQGSNPSASPVTIAVEDGVMIANARVNGTSFQVRYTPGGVQVVHEIDDRQLPPDNHLQMPASTALQLALARQATSPTAPAVSSASRQASPGATADTGSTIDVLVAYTTQARIDAGGTSAIVAQINTAAGEANQAYVNSQIPQAMRVVGTMETNYTSAGLASGLIPDLQRVTGLDSNNNPDPNAPMADVRAMRETVRADLVSLWVEGTLAPNTSGTVGIAWVMNSSFLNNMQQFAFLGYSVVARAYATGTGGYTFAHEVGHNLGANHDRITDANLPFTPLYPFAFDFIAPGNAFHTVMAYASSCGQCPGILNFSNPNVTFNGVATGVAGNGPSSADNHQTLINTINAVINFRQCNQQPCGATPTPGPSATPTNTPPAALPNDNFPGTTVNALPYTNNLNTATATVQTAQGEPSPSCGNVGRTVWYSFTPSATTQTTISTVGSDFDTVLGVYTGGAVNALSQVICNDDINGSQNRQSQVTFSAVAGTTYRIQVGGFGGASGNLVVTMNGALPTNTPTATPTRTATPIPTPVVNCNPRPRVTVNAQAAGTNNLQVTILPGANGWINSVQIAGATNALIDIAGQTGVTGVAAQTFPMPPATLSLTFTVHHANPGQSTTVPLTVVDTCGSWQTLVGGGGSAF
jgi:hypothetical protein